MAVMAWPAAVSRHLSEGFTHFPLVVHPSPAPPLGIEKEEAVLQLLLLILSYHPLLHRRRCMIHTLPKTRPEECKDSGVELEGTLYYQVDACE
jgi:hypothetical protein